MSMIIIRTTTTTEQKQQREAHLPLPEAQRATYKSVQYENTLWRSQDRILGEGADFVVINKPGGVPSVPTVDNILENALHCTAQVGGPCFSLHDYMICWPHALKSERSYLA